MTGALFPYMHWAHAEASRARWSLAQSGMPAPDAALLEDGSGPPLAHPAAGALPAVEERLGELFGVPRERVLVTVGASSAMWIAAARWFQSGARVVTELPSYEPFRALPGLFGAELAVVRRRPERRFHLDPDEVARAARGGRPAHVFVCSPHNPTGAPSTAEEVAALARIAGLEGGVLVSNEVYMEFAPNEERVHAFALAPNAVSIGSLTKAYGLGALRVGWMVLGEEVAPERELLVDRAFLGYVDPPTPSLLLARVALERIARLRAPLARLERESRPHLVRWLAEEERVDGFLGPHGLTAFPRVRGVADTLALAQRLAREHEIAVVPGEFFGLRGHLRIGWGVPEATLSEGLARLSRALRG